MVPEFLKAMGRLLVSLGAGLVEPFRLARFNRNIQVGRKNIEALSDTQLPPYLESEWSRAKDLDDKLQKLTAALSVAVTVGGLVATTILQDLNAGPVKYITAALFLSAALYLLGGVWLGFNGLRPKARWGYGTGFIAIAEGKDKVAARNERIEALANFERDNLIRSNEASAATSAIRNGVLFFGAALIVGVAAAGQGKSKPNTSTPTISAVPEIHINVRYDNGSKIGQQEACVAFIVKQAQTSLATVRLSADHRATNGRAAPVRNLGQHSSQSSSSVQTTRSNDDSVKEDESCVASAPAENKATMADGSLKSLGQ